MLLYVSFSSVDYKDNDGRTENCRNRVDGQHGLHSRKLWDNVAHKHEVYAYQ